MTYREYIGARYVPLFADPLEWDSTKTYEPLTVVYYQGNSYTSRQAVPAGIEITNNTYWALTGNYNAQIEQYRSEVQTFDTRITTNNTNIAAETTARQNADTSIREDLGDDIDDLQMQVTSIDNRVTALESRDMFVIFGDSWSAFAEVSNWYELANIGNVLNCNMKNYARSGAGFTRGSSLIPAQLNTADSDMSADEKARTKYVVVTAGLNDFYPNALTVTYNEWAVLIFNFLSDCQTMFPNARIVYAPSVCNHRSGWQKCLNVMRDYTNLMKDMMQLLGNSGAIYPVSNMPYFWVGYLGTAVFVSDNAHLNNRGAVIYGKLILAACSGQSLTPIKAFEPYGNLVFQYGTDYNSSCHGTFNANAGTTDIITVETPFTEWAYSLQYVCGYPCYQGHNGNALQNGFVKVDNQQQVRFYTSSAQVYYL